MLGRLAASFRDAFRGVAISFATQRNFRIHLLAAVLVLGVGLWLGVSAVEWAILALTVGGVLAAEMANTALEALADAASPEFHPLVGRAKDVMAGMVLVAAASSVVEGLLVLGPRLLAHLR